jgi:ribosomal protein S18 acetylase RimI-like enzyme
MLNADEVARFAVDPAHQIGHEFVDRARGGLDLCFAALRGERLASYCWVATGSVERAHAAGVDLGLPTDTAYLYKGVTHPDFRGHDLYPACMATALTALHPRGVERLVAFVYWSNEAALRSCARLGYRRLGRLVVGARRPLHVPTALRRLGVTLGEAAQASLARTRPVQARPVQGRRE